ncbi:MAG: hypothetical protein CBB87_03525 [Micavibrio sp. TMED27]|nr:hypothetical protein [Micavibrio sp.]OUT91900.1 MAG: hypothetical protein CBB87_03525 [Micavibrio sp. TMED27]|tara:strand:+ start:1479 stop:2597 length:1119 start_codon:yes stop_codon:yes gene_type:complete
MTSDVTISGALQQQANTSQANTKLAEDFSQFLNLLTVQLQNQDPLSPMDTTEFTNQLVAFTGVEQQINTNQKLDSLVALGIGSSFSSSQNYVGQEISYVASEFAYEGSSNILRYSMPEQASLSQINILNEAGEVVYSTEGSKNPGAHDFIWNGETNSGEKAVPGTYTIRVEALDVREEPIQVSTVVSGVVRGTETQNGEILLLVGERAVPVGSVLNTSVGNDLSASSAALTSAMQYIGTNVTFLNSQLKHDGNQSHNIIYNLESTAERAKLLVSDSNGNVVYTQDIDTDSGENITSWDGSLSNGGQAAAGDYTFTIDAINDSDARIPYTSRSSGGVTGVETQNGQIYLNIDDGKTVALSQVVSVDIPESGGA